MQINVRLMIKPASQINPIFEPLPNNGEATEIPEDLIEELEEDLEDKSEAVPHADILMRLLKQVKPVDFDKFTKLMQDLGFYWLAWNHSPWK